jgi:hypothetical protein
MAETFPVVPPTGYGQYRSGIAHGTIDDVSYYSSVAGRDLTMKVYTLPAYHTSQEYGVIYCYQGIGAEFSDNYTDFVGYWIETNCNWDLDGDYVITLYEFAEFARNWLDDSFQYCMDTSRNTAFN